MKRPYRIVLVRGEFKTGEEGWVAMVDELPGCLAQGMTPEEASCRIREAMELWFEASLHYGDPIPEPRQELEYKGKIALRIPPSLHRRLADTAACEGVSLNTYLTAVLAGAVGWGTPKQTMDGGARRSGHKRATPAT